VQGWPHLAVPAFGAEGTNVRVPATKFQGDQERGAPAGDIASGASEGAGEVSEEVRRLPVQDRYFGAEVAAILDTWLPPTCKLGSGRGRDRGGRV
jgi:hypothetical protein